MSRGRMRSFPLLEFTLRLPSNCDFKTATTQNSAAEKLRSWLRLGGFGLSKLLQPGAGAPGQRRPFFVEPFRADRVCVAC